MKRFYLLLCISTLLLSGCKDNEVDITVIKDTEVTVTTNSATFSFYVENQNGAISAMTVEEYGVYISSKNFEPTDKDKVFKLKENDADFYYEYAPSESGHNGKICKINCTGLSPGQTYYARPYVANRVSKLTGEVVSFKTAASPDDKITIKFNSVSNVTSTTADVNGTLTIGEDAVGKMKELGFFYSSTSTKPGQGDKYLRSTSVSNLAAGTYDINWQIKDLSPNTKYYVRMYYKEGTTYHYSADTRSFTTLSNSSSVATLNDFLGYYTCHANKDGYDGPTEWYINITSFYDEETQCNWIEILGFDEGDKRFTAFGPFDATKGYARLQGGWYDTDYPVYFDSSGDTAFYALMYPRYYDSNSGNAYYLQTDETSTPGTTSGEILLKRNADGSLYLTPSDKPDKNNRYANCVSYDYLQEETVTWKDFSTFSFWLDGTTYTKLSSDQVPAKTPSKKKLRQQVKKSPVHLTGYSLKH